MAETAQEVWDRVVERARKERQSMPKSNDDKDPYRMSQRVAHYERTQGSYVGDRKLSEEEADKRYARTASTAEMDRLLKQREEAKRKGYESLGEMNYYEGDQKSNRDAGVQKLAQRYAAGKGNRGSTGDFNLDPSVEQYYKDDNGRKRVMLLPKMQYQTGVNQQRISNEMADRAFEADQAYKDWARDFEERKFDYTQQRDQVGDDLAMREFGIREGQLTGRYRSQDVSNLLNQLGALKEQGSVAGKSNDYYSGLRSQADAIRNQLTMQGYDPSGLGANVGLQDFYKAAGNTYRPTLGAEELSQRGREFEQDQSFKREQVNFENAFQREKFERSKFESDRDYNLAKLRASQAKASTPKTPKISKQQTYADALTEFKQHVEAAKQAGSFQGAARMEQELFSNPAFIQNLVAQGYDLDTAVDALYNAATNGQMRTKKDALDYAKQAAKDAKQRQQEEEEEY